MYFVFYYVCIDIRGTRENRLGQCVFPACINKAFIIIIIRLPIKVITCTVTPRSLCVKWVYTLVPWKNTRTQTLHVVHREITVHSVRVVHGEITQWFDNAIWKRFINGSTWKWNPWRCSVNTNSGKFSLLNYLPQKRYSKLLSVLILHLNGQIRYWNDLHSIHTQILFHV